MFKALSFFILLSSTALLAKNGVLIENVTIVSPHLPAPQTHMNVLIKEGRIADVTAHKIAVYDQKIDASDKFLSPGIMDSHAHVSSIPGMGFGVDPVSANHPKLTRYYYSQQPRSFLYHGVTQILDPNPGVNFERFTSANYHPDYFRCEVITTKDTFPYVEKQDNHSRSMFRYLIDEKAQENGVNSVEKTVLRISRSGAVCIKLYFEDGYGNNSQWPTLSPKTLHRIKISAKKAELLILAHANALDMQQLALAAGVDVIAHGMWNWGKYNRASGIPREITTVLDIIIANKLGYMPTQRVIAGLGETMILDIASSTAFFSVTPKPLLNWYKTADAQWFKEELRLGFDGMPDESIADVFLYGRIQQGNRIVSYLNQSNHSILLASDFPGSPGFANQPGLATFQEMKAMFNAGLSLNQVLAAATINNAKQFGMQNDYGTIETGKVANLLLLNSNPLSSIEAWDDIETVILHGEFLPRKTLSADWKNRHTQQVGGNH